MTYIMSNILSIDLGGSKCSLTLWQSCCSSLPQKLRQRTLPTNFADEQGLLAAVHAFLEDDTIEGCTLAMAGPADQAAEWLSLTNNPCRIRPAALRAGLGCPLAVVNDLEALAHALPALAPAQMRQIAPGSPKNPGFAAPALAAAVGTGLGVAARLPGGRVVPTEAGHCAFAPQTQPQLALWQGMRQNWAALPANQNPDQGHLSQNFPVPYNEQILSGAGLCNILYVLQPTAPTAMLQNPALITDCALAAHSRHAQATGSPTNSAKGPDKEPDETLQAAAQEVFRLFSSCLGSALRDLALVFLCSGGVYLGGGVLDKIGPLFDPAEFCAAFLAPGPHQSILAQIPVWQICEPDALSLGAAIYTERNLLG